MKKNLEHKANLQVSPTDIKAILTQVRYVESLNKKTDAKAIALYCSGYSAMSMQRRIEIISPKLEIAAAQGYLDKEGNFYPLNDAGRELLIGKSTLYNGWTPRSPEFEKARGKRYGKSLKLTRVAVGTRRKD